MKPNWIKIKPTLNANERTANLITFHVAVCSYHWHCASLPHPLYSVHHQPVQCCCIVRLLLIQASDFSFALHHAWLLLCTHSSFADEFFIFRYCNSLLLCFALVRLSTKFTHSHMSTHSLACSFIGSFSLAILQFFLFVHGSLSPGVRVSRTRALVSLTLALFLWENWVLTCVRMRVCFVLMRLSIRERYNRFGIVCFDCTWCWMKSTYRI